MDITTQNIIIALLIGASVIFLIFHLLKRRKLKKACANCPAVKISQTNKSLK